MAARLHRTDRAHSVPIEVGRMIYLVIRTFGSEKTHCVEVIPSQVDIGKYTSLGLQFNSIDLPAETICGTLLRKTKRFPVAVVMREKTPIRCVPCRRLSGMTEQPSIVGMVPPNE
jgi:hypothetical protein